MTGFPLRQGSDRTIYARHGDGLVRDFHPLPRGIGDIITQNEGKVKGKTKLLRKPRVGRDLGEVGLGFRCDESREYKFGFVGERENEENDWGTS